MINTGIDNNSDEEDQLFQKIIRNANVTNVNCVFNVECQLDLKIIASKFNFKLENEEILSLKLTNPSMVAHIHSHGTITCTGATTESKAKDGATKIFELLQKLGLNVKFIGYRVINVVVTFNAGLKINIMSFENLYKGEIHYDSVVSVSATLNMKDPKSTLEIFPSGIIVVKFESVKNSLEALHKIIDIILKCGVQENMVVPSSE